MSSFGVRSSEEEVMAVTTRPTTTNTTSSYEYEEQVILDLQSKLGQLAQQNRESIAQALSTAKATRSASAEGSTTSAAPSITAPAPAPAPARPTKDVLSSSVTGCPDSMLANGAQAAGSLPELPVFSVGERCPLGPSHSSPGQATAAADIPPRDLSRDRHPAIRRPAVDAVPIHARSAESGLSEPSLPYPDPLGRGQLERQLQDTKDRVFLLDSKLKKCNELCEQQKHHFRNAVVDLQTKLNDTIVGRNSVMELRRKEAESQERLINQLQETFADVEASNQQQAQVLQDAGSRVGSLHAELQACRQTLAQAQALAAHHAAKRGLVGTPVAAGPTSSSSFPGEGPAAVVCLLGAVLESYEQELDRVVRRAGKAETEFTQARDQFAIRWRENGEQQKETLRKLRDEQEEQLSAATERALNARKQSLGLQSQLTLAREQMQQLTDSRNSEAVEAQQRLQQLQEELGSVSRRLQSQCDSLSSDLETQKQQGKETAAENSRLRQQIQDLEQRLQEAKDSLAKAEGSSETLQRQNQRLTGKEREADLEVGELRSRLEAKTSQCQELGRLVQETKAEAARLAEQKISAAAEKSKHDMASLAVDLAAQADAAARCRSALEADLQRLAAELAEVRAKAATTGQELAEARREAEAAAGERAEAERRLGEVGRELRALREEKESVAASLEGRISELDAALSVQDQLQVQVKEREAQCDRLQEQTSSMAQLAEVTRKAGADWEQERAEMRTRLDAQAQELQDLRRVGENLGKKLRVRERRLRTLEGENRRLEEEAQGTVRETQTSLRTQEELRAELKQTRTQVDLLSIEREKLKAELQEKEADLKRGAGKSKSRVQALQRELLIAQKTIKATASMDGKAVQAAERMQKQVTAKRSEIDGLQGKVSWLRECLEAMRKEKVGIADDRDFYKAQVAELTAKRESHLTEQEIGQDTRSLQSSLVTKLEESLKKATLKHAKCKAVIARQEQDMVRLKLQHQLEMKELQRSMARAGPSTADLRPRPKTGPGRTRTVAATTRRTDNTSTGRSSVQNARKPEEGRNKESSPPFEIKVDSWDGGEVVGRFVPVSSRVNTRGGRPAESLDVLGFSPVVLQAEVDRDGATSRHSQTADGPLQSGSAARALTGEDLSALLLEMQGVVAGRPVLAAGRHAWYRSGQQPANQPDTRVLHSPAPDGRKRYEVSENNNSERLKAEGSHQRSVVMVTPLLTSSPVGGRGSPQPDSLSLLSSVPAVWDSPPVVPKPDPPARQSRSPVSTLLGTSPTNDSHYNNNNGISQSGAVSPTHYKSMDIGEALDASPSWQGGRSLTTSGSAISVDEGPEVGPEGEQLRLLQDKLQRLCQLGGDLQRENRDMASLIRRQDSGIRRCRQREKQAQRLVSGGQ